MTPEVYVSANLAIHSASTFNELFVSIPKLWTLWCRNICSEGKHSIWVGSPPLTIGNSICTLFFQISNLVLEFRLIWWQLRWCTYCLAPSNCRTLLSISSVSTCAYPARGAHTSTSKRSMESTCSTREAEVVPTSTWLLFRPRTNKDPNKQRNLPRMPEAPKRTQCNRIVFQRMLRAPICKTANKQRNLPRMPEAPKSNRCVFQSSLFF